MITEDYVSFETAKLLKEKGFDENCAALYSLESGEFDKRGVGYVFNNSQWDFYITAPTLQMVMKWLRENYGLHCDIGYDDLDWFWNIISVSDDVPVEDRPKMIQLGTACHKTYEDACADAIKYCLENLI